MTKKFAVRDPNPADESFFDRQRLIPWWDQDKISNARIMVVGAGALGNEAIKNLLLLGFRKLIVCDFDHIETSNLSRTVLFGPDDIGKSKARTAVERAKQLCLSDDNHIVAFHGDITSELGLGIFRAVDMVLGCLDNIEARRFVNRSCRLVGRPWIDAGINELAGHVSLYSPASEVCYECVLTDHQLKAARQRYSCDDVKRLHVQQARAPTVQVTSSIISGIQVQECVKFLCGGTAVTGRRIWFDGASNDFEVFTLRPRDGCEAHVSFDEITDVDLSHSSSVREALRYLAANGFGNEPVIDTLGLRKLVTQAACRKCGKPISLYRPLHTLTEADLVCEAIHAEDDAQFAQEEQPVSKHTVHSFAESTTEPEILDMSLADVGIPAADIIAVRVSEDDYRYVRLAADLDRPFAG